MSSVDFKYLIGVFETSQGLIPQYIEQIKKDNTQILNFLSKLNEEDRKLDGRPGFYYRNKKNIINSLNNIKSLGTNLYSPLAREHRDLAEEINEQYIRPISKIIQDYTNTDKINFELLEKTPEIYSNIVKKLKQLKEENQ